MDDLNTIRTLITVGGFVASIGGAWWLMKYQIGELKTADEKQAKELTALWAKLDTLGEEVSLKAQKLDVISGMLRPEKVAEHTTWVANITKDVEYIRRDLDEVDDRTKCKNCS